jgi:Domain of unknown function (DUF4288)
VVDWYSARLLIERTVEGGKPVKPLFEESVVVFKAADDATRGTVKRRANQLGRKANHHFKNAYGETVRWTFRELLEIQEIMTTDLQDGDEVYYRWWDNPSDRKLKMIRESHEEPWWK